MPRTLIRALARSAAIAGLSLGAALAPIGVAHAAPLAPSGLASTSEVIPVLSWEHSAGATSYVVELSTSADSSGLISRSETTNRSFVPLTNLPTPTSGSTLFWRVAAKDSAVGEFSSWTEISRTSYAAPTVTAPVSGHTFQQPASPATLAWNPVPGTQEYEVQVSTDQSFTDPTKLETFKTISTTLVVPRPQVATSYWFQVRARLSTATSGASAVYTGYSTPRSYSVSALPSAQRREPADDNTVVDDAVLDWDPILGAKTYDIQIATDPAFGSIVHERLNITGTSYARPATLNNDTYYWRVRASDVAGNVQVWTSRPTWRFSRSWPDLPQPVYPANPVDVDPSTPNDVDQGVVVDDLEFYYEWKPVRFASMYKVELATDSTFSDIVGACYTANTTYTPASQGGCMPGAEGTYWWRVSSMDQLGKDEWRPLEFPMTSQTTFLDARFTYSPPKAVPQSPADGATVKIPTLTWSQTAGAAQYRVTLLQNGDAVRTVTTAATSWTPPDELAAGTYAWDVQTITEDGRVGSGLLSGQPRFTVIAQDAPTASSPEVTAPALDSTVRRSPTLRWTPVANASSYKVWIRTAGGTGWDVAATGLFYPTFTELSTNHLAPGSYEWMARAVVSGSEVPSSSLGRFTIDSPAAVTGQANALTMSGYKAGQSCSGFTCTDLRETPVMRWDLAPETGYVKIWVARNANLSNLVSPALLGTRVNPFPASGSVWEAITALQESTAGEAYYWAVQPCYADNKCAANPVPLNSFNKASNPVDSLSPGVQVVNGTPQGAVPVLSDDVTLRWTDYLQTNTEAARGSSQLATKSGQSVREYEVQVAADDTFNDLLDTAKVDQRRFTSFATTYPEGLVYWRVRGIDTSGNPLPWSVTRGFNKQSPTPVLTQLSGAQRSTPVLSWAPLDFAADYQLEVYATGASVAKYAVTSNQVRWAPATAGQSLAPGEYEWRVRRRDALNRFGGWSARSTFTVANDKPTLVSPSAGGQVTARDSLLTWDPVPGATDYRVTLISPTSSTTTQVTKATSWAPTTKLAAGTWSWRVETRDTNGVVSAQSATQTFVVTDDLLAEQPTRITGSGALDTQLTGTPPVWNRQPQSVTYQWLSNGTPVGDGSLTYTVTSADLNRKISLRATAVLPGFPNATSTSASVTAVQGAAPIATTPPTIIGSSFVGATLTAGMPTWAAPDVTTTQRWLVNGSSVGTGTTFTLRASDLNKQVVLEVTGRRTGYAAAVVTSAPMTVEPGGALQATAPPTVTGTASVGQTVKASAGTWSQASPGFSYQWLRSGVPIPGATSSSYRLTPEDAGRDVSVTVIATKAGFADGASTSAAVAVSRMAATISGTLKSERVKVKKKAVLSVVLSVPGLETPQGAIQVLDKGKKIAQMTMAPVHKGKTSFKLTKLKKGKHKLQVVYLGNAQTFGAKSKTIVLYVVK